MNIDDLAPHLDWRLFATTVVQIFIIVYAILWIWGRIRGTQAERLVKGVLILCAITVASYFLEFRIITSLLQHLIPVAVMAMVIVFQPEIRRGLGYLGRVKTLRADLSLSSVESEKYKHDVGEIIAAVRDLSRHKIGALIVIEPPEGERDYVSPGTPVNADISMNLLVTIFFPRTPLHDGAVVIRNDKIVAAGVILPMTADPKLSYKYGTRHRAAIGLSEIYDGLCIVVSEETGSISAANRGMLVRYQDAEELREPIEYLYHKPSTDSKTTNPWVSFLTLFKKGADTASGDAASESDAGSKTSSGNPGSGPAASGKAASSKTTSGDTTLGAKIEARELPDETSETDSESFDTQASRQSASEPEQVH